MSSRGKCRDEQKREKELVKKRRIAKEIISNVTSAIVNEPRLWLEPDFEEFHVIDVI